MKRPLGLDVENPIHWLLAWIVGYILVLVFLSVI